MAAWTRIATAALSLTVVAARGAQAQRQNDEWMCGDTKGKLQVEACTRTLHYWPRAEWFIYRGEGFMYLGQYGDAVADFTEALKQDSSEAWLFDARGEAYNALGEYQWAIRDFRQVLTMKPNDAFALAGLGIAFGGLRRVDDARHYFDMALAADPGSAGNLSNICRQKAKVGYQLKEALENCTSALKIESSESALDSRTLVNFRLGNYADAISDSSAALERNAKLASCLFVRGVARLKTGDKTGGDADIAAAKTINPRIADIYAGYGVTP